MENIYTEETTIIDERRKEAAGELMRNVYLWMTGGLALTGIVAWIVATTPMILNIIFGSQIVFWGLLIAELIFVIVLSAAIEKLSFGVASMLYTLYCVLNGVTLSSIFLLYELSSVAESIWISVIGVIIFAGLTVYDAQKIRLMMLSQDTVNEGNMKLALLGALSLYLDFINLLLRLLSLFGKRK